MPWVLTPIRESDLLREVQQKGARNVSACYQCGTCTAGCPVAYEMDYSPHQIIRAIQLGMSELVLSSRAIWLCAACETCSTRCPQGADPAAVMDALRQIAYAERIKSPESDVPLFHRIFLGGVRQFGRQFELGMIGLYNLLSGHYMKDITLAPAMLLKGKLNLLPRRYKDGKELKSMFARVRELEGELE